MDITNLVQSQWLTAQEVKNSPTKVVVIVDQGKLEESTSQKGEKYQALVLRVELDKVEKQWKLSRYAAKKLADKFSAETKEWLGKQVLLTTMLMQGGKEGIVPA